MKILMKFKYIFRLLILFLWSVYKDNLIKYQKSKKNFKPFKAKI